MASDFFQDGWAEVTHRVTNGGSFSETMGSSHSWHLGCIHYLHTDTDTCMHLCILTADCLKRPLKKDQL